MSSLDSLGSITLQKYNNAKFCRVLKIQTPLAQQYQCQSTVPSRSNVVHHRCPWVLQFCQILHSSAVLHVHPPIPGPLPFCSVSSLHRLHFQLVHFVHWMVGGHRRRLAWRIGFGWELRRQIIFHRHFCSDASIRNVSRRGRGIWCMKWLEAILESNFNMRESSWNNPK